MSCMAITTDCVNLHTVAHLPEQEQCDQPAEASCAAHDHSKYNHQASRQHPTWRSTMLPLAPTPSHQPLKVSWTDEAMPNDHRLQHASHLLHLCHVPLGLVACQL